jgi:AAA+ superfamily predicted ATPase
VLSAAVAAHRSLAPDGLTALYVSDTEVDALLGRSAIAREASALPDRWCNDQLTALGERAGLLPFDQATLLLACAVALDHRYARLCAYLQDDLTRAYATPGLALQLFAPPGTAASMRRRFVPSSPLCALQLLALSGDESQPLMSRAISVPEAVVEYLLGDSPPEAPGRSAKEIILPDPGAVALQHAREVWRSVPVAERPVFAIVGEAGSGRRLAASKLADALDLPLVEADGHSPAEVRDALFRDAAICLPDADPLFEADGAEALRAIAAALACTSLPVALTLATSQSVPSSLGGRRVRILALPPSGGEERALIWQQEAAFADIDLEPEHARLLANTYRLNGRDVAAAVERAGVPDGSETGVLERLAAAAKVMASVNLGRLGQEVMPRFGWQDIVLPTEVSENLRELVIRVRHRPLVFGEWGFTQRHARSHSISALFAGPSGTGKTMAAEVIASELNLPLYRVDLSAVVSKYIGETEKNLSQIFNEASASSAVLFFDEADALFGKRSEVKDAHDRYANIEVSYLLQRMEDYEGIIILASNLRQNLDEAFTRRLHLVADFPFPDEDARLEIWRRNLPPSLPLLPDVDLPTLAKDYRLSGGAIRNACVGAAFLAASEDSAVGMSHLQRAVRREHQKMGKLLLAGEGAAP